MVGTGSRLYFGLAVLALLGAGAYGLASGGDPIGVASMGYKGGVGEHLGYVVLTGLGLVTLTLGVVNVALRDVDPAAVVASPADALPEAPAPASASVWPLVGGVGLVVTALGLVVGAGMFALGLVILAVTVVEWAVQSWADRATGDPEVNRAIRDRLMAPMEIPVAAVLVIAFLALGMSRVFLAVSKTGSWVIGTVLLVLIVLGALLVLSRPKQTRTLAKVLLAVVAVGVLAGGIAGVVAGEREFHHEEPGHEAEE